MGANNQFGASLSKPAVPLRLKFDLVPFGQSLPGLRQPRLRLWPEFVQVPKPRLEVLISNRRDARAGYQILPSEVRVILWNLLQRESIKQNLTRLPTGPPSAESQEDSGPDRFMFVRIVPVPGTGQLTLQKDLLGGGPSLDASWSSPSDDDRLELLFLKDDQPRWSVTVNVTANFDLTAGNGLTSVQAQASAMFVQPLGGDKLKFVARLKSTLQGHLGVDQAKSIGGIADIGFNYSVNKRTTLGVAGGSSLTFDGHSAQFDHHVTGGFSITF